MGMAHSRLRVVTRSAWWTRTPRLPDLLAALAGHDAIVSSHAAELLEAKGVTLDNDAARAALAAAAPEVREGVTAYLARGEDAAGYRVRGSPR